MNIGIVREAPDKLTRKNWLFSFDTAISQDITFRLDQYAEQSRETPRHKYVSLSEYSRIRYGLSRGVTVIDPKNVQVPLDVAQEAKRFIIDKINEMEISL